MPDAKEILLSKEPISKGIPSTRQGYKYQPFDYQKRDLNSEHTRNANGRGLLFSSGWQSDLWFSNGLGHWKTKLLATLDHFVLRENVLC